LCLLCVAACAGMITAPAIITIATKRQGCVRTVMAATRRLLRGGTSRLECGLRVPRERLQALRESAVDLVMTRCPSTNVPKLANPFAALRFALVARAPWPLALPTRWPRWASLPTSLRRIALFLKAVGDAPTRDCMALRAAVAHSTPVTATYSHCPSTQLPGMQTPRSSQLGGVQRPGGALVGGTVVVVAASVEVVGPVVVVV